MARYIVIFTDGTRAPDLYAIDAETARIEARRYARENSKHVKYVKLGSKGA